MKEGKQGCERSQEADARLGLQLLTPQNQEDTLSGPPPPQPQRVPLRVVQQQQQQEEKQAANKLRNYSDSVGGTKEAPSCMLTVLLDEVLELLVPGKGEISDLIS